MFNECEQRILAHARGITTTCFRTSIWDETLYRAWSRIVYSLVPNTALLEVSVRCDSERRGLRMYGCACVRVCVRVCV